MKYIFWGKVKRGRGRGKQLGHATANLSINDIDICKQSGVYVSLAKINKTFYRSVTFIGIAKTFNEKIAYAECHLLSYNENLYNKWISIRLLKKIRKGRKFSSADDLIRQIEKDVKNAEIYFTQKPLP